MNFKPLRVTWRLCRPMISRQHEIHLDALLAFARVKEANGDWSAQDDLPLARATVGEDWCFKASALLFDAAQACHLMHMCRRTDVTQISLDGAAGGPLKLRLAEIDTGRGYLKGYSMLQSTQVIKDVTAWCIGDPERVVELLSGIPSIGKLGRNSFGLVESFSVEEAAQSETGLWAYRALPRSFDSTEHVLQARSAGVAYALALGRTSSPYWAPEKTSTLEPIGFAR